MTNIKKRERAKTTASLISLVPRFSDICIMFAGLWLVCEASGLSFLYLQLLVSLITLVVFQMLGGITDFYRSWRGVRAATEFALLLQNWTLSVIFSAGLIAENPGKKLVPYYTVKEFVESLETPRRILLMVKAGAGTDAAIDSLKPYLDIGDIIIDGGNTFFQDTIRRNRELSAEGFNFIGTGVSGGEEGALKGPSIMPGGQKEAYELIAPILTKIAAVAEDGEPCVTYIGADGAGHYVKMVHNGIEYGDMQLIAEAYSLLKGGLNLSNEELAQTFTEWNNGELSSYLIDITKDIFTKKYGDGNYLVDVILDEAANKGTGKWTSQSALDLGEPLSLITESVFARYISSLKDQRVASSKVLSGPQAQTAGDKGDFIEKVRRA